MSLTLLTMNNIKVIFLLYSYFIVILTSYKLKQMLIILEILNVKFVLFVVSEMYTSEYTNIFQDYIKHISALICTCLMYFCRRRSYIPLRGRILANSLFLKMKLSLSFDRFALGLPHCNSNFVNTFVLRQLTTISWCLFCRTSELVGGKLKAQVGKLVLSLNLTARFVKVALSHCASKIPTQDN